MSNQRSGPWSAEEKQFVSDQAGKMTPEEIADKIHRNHKTVVKYMTKNGLMKYYYKKDLEQDELQNIRKSRYWEQLEQEFTDDELESFEYHWKNIVRQFRDDILHTEEIQIVDAITLEIKMHRCQKRQKEAEKLIKDLRLKMEIEEAKQDPSDRLLERYSRDIANLYSGMESFNKDYVTLLKEKNSALKQLKATRELRVSQIENSKETLVGWVKKLYNDPKTRYELGLRIEKMRLASREEYKRLSEYHTYADGKVDQPIFNHETVKLIKETTKDTPKQEDNV